MIKYTVDIVHFFHVQRLNKKNLDITFKNSPALKHLNQKHI